MFVAANTAWNVPRSWIALRVVVVVQSKMRECQEGNSDDCARCYKLIAPFLIEETKRQRIEIDALKDEIAQLKKQKNEGAED
eukprot:scaffold28586_cov107-Skeletonema_dohrnii-CCMP3373.AAC.14